MGQDIELLVEQSRRGDRKAFSTLVRKYELKIYRTAYFLTGNSEDAKDIAQNTFICAYRNIGQFKGKSSFYTWLYRILLNLFYKWVRKRKRASFATLADVSGINDAIADASRNPHAILEKKEAVMRLIAAIDSLPEKYRTVVILRHLERLGYDEMANILKCPKGTIKSRIHKARLLLAEKLQKKKIKGV